MFAYKARGHLGGQRIGGFVPVERGLLLSSTSEVAADEVPAFQHTSGSACMWVCSHFLLCSLPVGVKYLACARLKKKQTGLFLCFAAVFPTVLAD